MSGLFCRWCGTELVQGRVAGYSQITGEPQFTYVCPNDRWWKVFAFHSFNVAGRWLR